jgi:hypothetical protein
MEPPPKKKMVPHTRAALANTSIYNQQNGKSISHGRRTSIRAMRQKTWPFSLLSLIY